MMKYSNGEHARFSFLVLLSLLASAHVACGGSSEVAPTGANGSTLAGSHKATLPVCPAFDPAHPSLMGCGAARAYVNCTASNGAGLACLSNDPTQCAGSDMVSPGCSSNTGCASGFSCDDACHPDEFGVSCGAIGPAPGPDVPPMCRTVAPTPAGVVFACCPCGLK